MQNDLIFDSKIWYFDANVLILKIFRLNPLILIDDTKFFQFISWKWQIFNLYLFSVSSSQSTRAIMYPSIRVFQQSLILESSKILHWFAFCHQRLGGHFFTKFTTEWIREYGFFIGETAVIAQRIHRNSYRHYRKSTIPPTNAIKFLLIITLYGTGDYYITFLEILYRISLIKQIIINLQWKFGLYIFLNFLNFLEYY